MSEKDNAKTTDGSGNLGVMIVGAGTVAGGYLDFFSGNSRTRLVAVADPSSAVREKVIKSHSPELLLSDYKEGLVREDIGLVVVCTPHDLHYPVVMDSLRAGKDVMCEKPIAISVQEADEMIDMAEKCGRKFFVTLNMRFQPWAMKIKELLDDGGMGQVFMARSAYLGYEVDRLSDPNNWKGDLKKAGGGVLLDGGYHIVDLMNMWLGRPVSVQAMGRRCVIEAQNKGEDNVLLQVEYASGSLATLQVSFTACSPGCHETPTLRLEHGFWGTGGTISCSSGWDPVRGAQQNFDVLRPDRDSKIVDLSNYSAPNMHEHFTDCLVNGNHPLVMALDARNATAVVEAAYESMRTGGKVKVAWRES